MAETLSRWRIKKAARKTVVFGSLASSSIALRRLTGKPKVRVITYHRFGDVDHDPWWLPERVFDEQMRWLAERQLAISLDQLLRFVRGEIELRAGSVLVTIDDGCASVATVAAPVLRRYAIPAVAYVTTRAIGNLAAGNASGGPYLTWDQTASLGDSGIAIGSHSVTHRSLARLTPDEIREEGLRSKELIESHIGKKVTSFAYPFGMRRDENALTEKILADCGYSSVFISQHGTIHQGSNPLRLPRIKVEAGEPLWMFKVLCEGGMDAWSLVDRVT